MHNRTPKRCPTDIFSFFFSLKSSTTGVIDLYISCPNPYLQLLVFYPAKCKKNTGKTAYFYQRKPIVFNVLYYSLVYQNTAVLSKKIH